MKYFKFLYDSGIICLPLNTPEKMHWQHLFEKPEEAELIRIPILCFVRSDPFFDKIHALVVTVELIWLLLLNILSFNFVPMPNKFLLGWQDSEEAM